MTFIELQFYCIECICGLYADGFTEMKIVNQAKLHSGL